MASVKTIKFNPTSTSPNRQAQIEDRFLPGVETAEFAMRL